MSENPCKIQAGKTIGRCAECQAEGFWDRGPMRGAVIVMHRKAPNRRVPLSHFRLPSGGPNISRPLSAGD
jgi:hypothetical protein